MFRLCLDVFRLALPVLLAGFCSSVALAQRGLTDIPDPDPAKQQASFEVAEGFTVNLFAAEPMIAKPIQMNWDTQGRLWVATSETYPQVKPGQVANDKIFVLEDTDGDGVADKQTVFADGLLMPTAILPGDGGVYVGASTELLHLKDTDGDGVADQKRIVLSGFGTEDTHHMIHTLRRGPAGKIYFNQSIYTHSHLETPFGVKRLLAGGTWKMVPETIDLEVYCRGLVNPWGLVFDEWGQSFETDGAGGEGIHYVFPDVVMITAHNAERVVRGLSPGQPKHCGLELLSGDHLPEGWAGRFVTNDFRGNRINSFELSPSGSGYVAVQTDNLLTSSYVSFRPIDILMGPDGAIYVADWYNPIIQHGEVDFRDERRDQERGRIWRIAPAGKQPTREKMPADRDIPELLALLKHSQKWWREAARTELAAREHQDVLPLALEWTSQQAGAADQAFLEGLWLLQKLEQVPADLLQRALSADNHRVRAAAVRLSCDVTPAETLLPQLAAAIQDQHPQVRLEALHGLRHLGTPQSLLIATQVVSPEAGNDPFLNYSIWQTFRSTETVWLPELQANADWQNLPAETLLTLARSTRSTEVLTPLLEWWQSGKIAGTHTAQVLSLVAERGGPAQLQTLWNLMPDAAQASRQQAILGTLISAAEKRNQMPASNRDQVVPFLGAEAEPLRIRAAQLAGLWKVSAAVTDLRVLAESGIETPAVRKTALLALARIGGSGQQQYLQEIAHGRQLPGLQLAAMEALALLNVEQAAQAAVHLLQQLPKGVTAEQVIQPFLVRQQGPGILAKALKDVSLTPEIAAIGVQRANSLTQKSPALVEAFQKAGALEPLNRMLTAEDYQRLVAAVNNTGNMHRGEVVYRRENLQCLKCHAIGGAGGKVGPDLTSIGASAPVDYLIESLFEPNKKIKEGYHTLQVVTVDGLVKAGVPVLQNEQEVHLRNAEGKIEVIKTDDIELSQISPVSLMPAELVNKLPQNELVDLVRFLSALGKTGELVVTQNRYVRTWEVLSPGSNGAAIVDALRHNGAKHAVSNDPLLPWVETWSYVQGHLPVQPLALMNYVDGKNLKFARFNVDVITAGEIGFKVEQPAGLQIWIDDQPIPAAELVQHSLTAGRHRVTIAVDVNARNHPQLRVELVDVPGSPAQAQLINN